MGKLVADIIVETLQNSGVKHCYGVVGDTLNLIARSLEKSEIEWVSVRHAVRNSVRKIAGSPLVEAVSVHLLAGIDDALAEIGMIAVCHDGCSEKAIQD